MNKYIVLGVLLLSGCNTINKAFDPNRDKKGEHNEYKQPPESMPTFKIPLEAGRERLTLWGPVPEDLIIPLQDSDTSHVEVFYKDAGMWFRLGAGMTSAPTFNLDGTLVKLRNVESRGDNYYCIYQDVAIKETLY